MSLFAKSNSKKDENRSSSRKLSINVAIDEIKSKQVFSGIQQQLEPLVERSTDLDTFTNDVMTLVHNNNNETSVYNFDSPQKSSQTNINNYNYTNTNNQFKKTSKALGVSPSELIEAVKELTETAVC